MVDLTEAYDALRKADAAGNAADAKALADYIRSQTQTATAARGTALGEEPAGDRQLWQTAQAKRRWRLDVEH